MLMTSWITCIAPYCENYTSRALDKGCNEGYIKQVYFNCRLIESSVGISLMLSGRRFQAVCPATQKKSGRRIWCKMIVLVQQD